MTKLTSLFLIIIFIVSLFIGIAVGVSVKVGQITPTPTNTKPPITSKSIGSILVLGVTNFDDEEIYLESAWVVSISKYQAVTGNLVEALVVGHYPVAPGQSQMNDPNKKDLLSKHEPIVFPRAFLEDISNFNLLNSLPVIDLSNIYFQDVVIIDEYAMNYLVELAKPEPQIPPAPVTENTFVKPWNNPLAAQNVQTTLLSFLCAPPHYILRQDNFVRVFDLLPGHFKTTVSIEDVINFYRSDILESSETTINCSIIP